MAFLISQVAAQPTINLQKQNFQPGETLLGTITTPGEFAKEISIDDIEFFEGRKKVFFEHDLVFYNKTYFFYVYLTREGNFTIRVKDILYKTPELKSATIEKNIEVKKINIQSYEKKINQTTNETYYENKTIHKILSIKPGLVFSSKKPEFILANKGDSVLNLSCNGKEFLLAPEDYKKILFEPNASFSYFEVKTYATFRVPVIYIPLTNKSQEIETKLKANPSSLQLKIIAGKEEIKQLELLNFGETNITEISISTNIPILKFSELKEINAKEVKNISLKFYSEKTGFFDGNISVEFHQDEKKQLLIVPIRVYVFPKNTSEENLEINEKSCAELGGEICSSNLCDGESTFTYEGYCCLGNCRKEEENEKSYGWLFGVGILLFLGIIGFLVYRKFKKIKPQKPEEHLREKAKIYEKQVKGKLSRI